MAFSHDFRRRTLFARHENRLFYPVVFCDGPKVTPAGDIYYTVSFSDGWCKNVASCDIVGPHFSSIDAGTQLYLGQRIFAYYMGQEHRGSVIDQVGDNVRVRLDLVSELLIFKTGQLRLSGDIARPHFGSLDSFQNMMKPRPSQSDICLPKGRSQTASPIYEENKKEDDAQDIKTAALALTSLSLSPAVTGKNEEMQNQRFVFPLTTPREEDQAMEPGGMQADEGYSDSIIKPRTRSFETPKLTKSREKRAGSLDLHVDDPIREQKLERAESWDVEKYGPGNKTQKLEKGNKAFKCMWRGCGRVLMSLPGIVRHVRTAHLGPKTEDNVEFYFNDLFIENDASISSDDSLLSSGISDDDALLENEDTKKEGLHMTARRDDTLKTFLPSDRPKNDNMHEYFLPRADKGARTKIGKGKGRIRSSREKAGYAGLETARKCRKVYGMDNRNLWCTQCRWKKACVRFGK